MCVYTLLVINKQSVRWLGFFPTENISYSSMLTVFCSLCSCIYGIHVHRRRGKELNQSFKNVCLFSLGKYHLNRQQSKNGLLLVTVSSKWIYGLEFQN